VQGSLVVSQSLRQLVQSVVVQVGLVQAGQVQAGWVVLEPGPTGLPGLPGPTGHLGLPGQAILVLAVVAPGAVAIGLLAGANLAGHLENLQAGRLGNHLGQVLESHQDTGATDSWPGRRSTRRQGSCTGLAGQGWQGPVAGWRQGTCQQRVSLGCRKTMRRRDRILPGELLPRLRCAPRRPSH